MAQPPPFRRRSWEGLALRRPGKRLSRSHGLRPFRRRLTHAEPSGAGATAPEPAFPITILTRGDVPAEARRRAEQVVVRAARHARPPVVGVRVALEVGPGQAPAQPAEAKASVDVNGRMVRARAGAGGIFEAIDVLDERLRRNLAGEGLRRRRRRRSPG